VTGQRIAESKHENTKSNEPSKRRLVLAELTVHRVIRTTSSLDQELKTRCSLKP